MKTNILSGMAAAGTLGLVLGLASPYASAGTVQFAYTSDSHYGFTRPAFRGRKNADAREVNAALAAAINSVPGLTFPCGDGGVNACKPVGALDFVAHTGDISNRSEKIQGKKAAFIQSAAASWGQFEEDYLKGLTVKDRAGEPAPVYLVPGNHDVSNAIGFHRALKPASDAAVLTQIYNRMLRPAKPRTAASYDYSSDKVYYARETGGVRFEFISMWPESAARAWLESDLAGVSTMTPVVLFTHDEPEGESKHFTNPNGDNGINSKDKFENLLSDKFADAAAVNDVNGAPVPAGTEQRAFTAFLKKHKNVVAYFHGNTNYNQFYTYSGPDGDVALSAFRVDSPLKSEVSANDDGKLSFQVASLDTAAKTMTVREYLWDAKKWGASVTVSLSPRAK